jgi:hypothetical protein
MSLSPKLHMSSYLIRAYFRRPFDLIRLATWRGRDLPHFIIIGAQKGGTTSLFYYLSQHPQLLPSYKKEVHFFDGGTDPQADNYAKGVRWYRSHFPMRISVGPHQKTFEASPLYLYNSLAPRRIYQLMPRAKLIALLRNPIDRAVAHYFHERRKRREPLPLLEALQKEEERLKPVVEHGDYRSAAYRHCSYKRRGLYKIQLSRYFEHFSREQLLILSSESFFANPAASLKRVFEFVGVDPDYHIGDLTPRNVADNRSEIGQEVYAYLESFFRPHNRALYEYIGEDYGWPA